ncbi:RDD family protein [Thalassotalea ganghwensis]
MTTHLPDNPTSADRTQQMVVKQDTINDSELLSSEETRQILTPFAFKIDKSLFGLALASPVKRAFALLVDLMIIAVLAEAPGELLALIAAYALFRLVRKRRNNGKRATFGVVRFLLRMIALLIMFIVALSYLAPLINEMFETTSSQSQVDKKIILEKEIMTSEELSLIDSVPLAALVTKTHINISNSQCSDKNCWLLLLSESVAELNQLSTSSKNKQVVLQSWVEQINLAPSERTKVFNSLSEGLKGLVIGKEKSQLMQTANDKAVDNKLEQPALTQSKSERSMHYRGLEWLKGVIDDLGLSFGWAALYFSVLTARWQGQTIGKKLMKIRVIQLDGTPLSVWDSFGRYGGYGAGLATGLLGFLQIFWDANRQCIHDKISATVVIDLTKK